MNGFRRFAKPAATRPTNKAPAANFGGLVLHEEVYAPEAPSRLSANVAVYRVAEPKVVNDGATHPLSGVDALTLEYPDGSHDAEAAHARRPRRCAARRAAVDGRH